MNKTVIKSKLVKAMIPIFISIIISALYIISNINKTNEYDNIQNTMFVDMSDKFKQSYDTMHVMSNKLISKYTAKIKTLKKDISGNHTYEMSKRGHEFIKSYESCKLTAYHIRGEKYNSIGWGHYLQEKHERGIKKISQQRADELFMEDIAWVNKAVTSMLNEVNSSYRWPQGIVDGLGSLVYNCGEYGVRTTEFYKRLKNCRFHNGEINESDIAYALAVVKKTRCSLPGHYKRRIGEFEMMSEIFS